jgi:hypothetical protein
MTDFGELLDDYNPQRDNVYPLFVNYFSNPILTKIKDVEMYSVYMSKIHALLGIEFRYIVVFVNRDNKPVGTTIYLANLPWITLQTRTLTDDHKLPFHTYNPRRLPFFDHKIKLVHQDEKQYEYVVEKLPLKVILLPKTKGTMEYNANGTIVNALETYQTIVSFSS